MNKPFKFKVIILLALAALTTLSGFRCNFVSPAEQQLLQPINLTWWGVFDDQTYFNDVINDYRALHSNVTVTYRRLRPEEFESVLLEALAEDRGPDIITIHNTWVNKYASKLEPLPATTKMAYERIQKTLGIKEEKIVEFKETTSLTAAQLKDLYIDVVYDDVVRAGKIYGLPLSVDTLVLFYNRDLFNNAKIPLPPANWVQVQENVKRLTFQDRNGNLIQAGVALGTADNVERSTDILALLMMQNGAEMTIGQQVTFSLIPPNFPDKNYNPGPVALRFFTDFANSAKEVYTWNKTFPNSLEAFAAGKVAMIFGYNYDVPYLEAKRQGKLNYAIAKMPQIDRRPETNFANYWVQVVSKKSKNINEAWDFLQFISRKSEVKKYLDKTGRVTALRSLIDEEVANDKLNIFANQLLTAKSWYRGFNPQAAENALKELIENTREGADFNQTLNIAVQKIQQTMQ